MMPVQPYRVPLGTGPEAMSMSMAYPSREVLVLLVVVVQLYHEMYTCTKLVDLLVLNSVVQVLAAALCEL